MLKIKTINLRPSQGKINNRCGPVLKTTDLRPTQENIKKTKHDGPVLKNNVVGTYTRENKIAVVQCSKRMNLNTSTRKNKKNAVVLCLKR